MSKYPNSRQNTSGAKPNEATTSKTRALSGTFATGASQSAKEEHKDFNLPTYKTRTSETAFRRNA